MAALGGSDRPFRRVNTAQDWSLSVAAPKEALDYYGRFHDVIEADTADELALSEEHAQSHPPKL